MAWAALDISGPTYFYEDAPTTGPGCQQGWWLDGCWAGSGAGAASVCDACDAGHRGEVEGPGGAGVVALPCTL